MGDHSKIEQRHADQAHMRESWHPPRSTVPRCACGEPAVIEVSRWPGVEFFWSEHRAMAEAAFCQSRPDAISPASSNNDARNWRLL